VLDRILQLVLVNSHAWGCCKHAAVPLLLVLVQRCSTRRMRQCSALYDNEHFAARGGCEELVAVGERWRFRLCAGVWVC
jgi:hypothetical protein